ncbi:unnamed protein product [Adineta steineri]|uniref:DUF7865 domain-containing protein n=1 Tax=Adineta steineri TaxID=433720 RepID=A0A814IWX0_9BILA|nr:unnamed protein product [Adineta steineri]
MSFSSFQAQIDSLKAIFTAQTPDKFRRTQLFIYETFRANQLLVVPETNWQLAFTTAADNYVVATVPRNSFGNNYSCITSLDSFSRPLYIDANYNTTLLPGVVAGCLPIDGIRLSTLECFFDSKCIFSLTSIASTRTTTIWIAKPLNASTPSNYSSSTLIGNLVDSLFVEDWGIVCSSDFVAEQWWGYLWGRDVVTNFRDLKLLSIQFRILASLCNLAQQSIDNDTSVFLTNKLVTLEAMSFSSFRVQIDSLKAISTAQTSDKFRRTQLFIYEIFRANQLLVVPETNWQLAFTTAADNYVVATVPRNSFGNNYSCITSLDSFSRPLYIDGNYNTTVLPGVVASCLPIDGIRCILIHVLLVSWRMFVEAQVQTLQKDVKGQIVTDLIFAVTWLTILFRNRHQNKSAKNE